MSVFVSVCVCVRVCVCVCVLREREKEFQLNYLLKQLHNLTHKDGFLGALKLQNHNEYLTWQIY